MNAGDLKIEPATERDVPLILSLIRSLAEYERLSDKVVATEADLRDALFGERPAAEAVIAYVDGKPVGYALWFHTFSTFLGKRALYLEDLFVLPAWRAKGVGRALLAHLAGIALERECGRIEWAVLRWNETAIGFYQSIGATPITEWTVYRLAGDALSDMARARLSQD
jgi:GNAT superfamily N-acetyltransferase